ncbi:hypothetical protein RJ55_06835 [Drechmeria coniospora]|nr:hypothetical protein RJ55_06835 [Drechmeria coniospora]
MKNLIGYYALATTLAAGVVAHSHSRFHRHLNEDTAARNERRQQLVIKCVSAPDVYTTPKGKPIPAEVARHGLQDGSLKKKGESANCESLNGAQFKEDDKDTPPPPPSKPPHAETPAEPPRKTLSDSNPKAPTHSGSEGASGLDEWFVSNTIKCAEFPSQFGAVALDWLGLGGWSGLQHVPGYTSETTSIEYIRTGTSRDGDSCSPYTMCSYACPPGYQKTQWPMAQGARNESIGGLFCNSDGFLELTRPSHTTLCQRGVGNITIQNDLDEVVSTCRTDYPGTESMVIPAIAQPGQGVALTVNDQQKDYVWAGKLTSAQYYVNKKGMGAKDGCVWDSLVDLHGAGDKAPMNIGAGLAKGIIFFSIAPNSAVSTAKLGFNIQLIVDGVVDKKCGYKDGQFVDGVAAGCTASLDPAKNVVIRYYQGS